LPFNSDRELYNYNLSLLHGNRESYNVLFQIINQFTQISWCLTVQCQFRDAFCPLCLRLDSILCL